MATTTRGVPYPLGTDNNDAATDMQAIAEWIDAALSGKTTAQITALTGAALWDGRIAHNTDTGDTMVYRGATLGWCIAGAVVGSIVWMADTAVPAGTLYCDGTAYNTTTYAKLFAKIGSEFGANLPDLRNRFVAGLGADTSFDVMGETGGSKTVTIATANMPAHTHTGPSHTHGGTGLAAASGGAHTHTHSLVTDTEATHTHGVGTFSAATTGSNHNHALPSRLFADGLAIGASTQPNQGDHAYLVTGGSGAHTHTITGTSAAGGSHAHTVTGTITSGGAHTHTISGSTDASGTGATSSVGSGTAMTILNPYIVLKPYIHF